MVKPNSRAKRKEHPKAVVHRLSFHLRGLVHQTIAGPEHGLHVFALWMQTIAPGAGTPVHRHAREEASFILRGWGRLTIEGQETNRGPRSTLVTPPDAIRITRQHRFR